MSKGIRYTAAAAQKAQGGKAPTIQHFTVMRHRCLALNTNDIVAAPMQSGQVTNTCRNPPITPNLNVTLEKLCNRLSFWRR